jgi:hypothetical protein
MSGYRPDLNHLFVHHEEAKEFLNTRPDENIGTSNPERESRWVHGRGYCVSGKNLKVQLTRNFESQSRHQTIGVDNHGSKKNFFMSQIWRRHMESI